MVTKRSSNSSNQTKLCNFLGNEKISLEEAISFLKEAKDIHEAYLHLPEDPKTGSHEWHRDWIKRYEAIIYYLLTRMKKSVEPIQRGTDMNENELKLVVAENRHHDHVNRGIALIDEGVMKRVGLKQGDIAGIFGSCSTGAILMKSFPEDKGLEIVRIDGLIRRNAGTSIGEKVIVRKAAVKEAKSITIAPTDPRVRFLASGEVVRRNLLSRPLVKGDLIFPTPPKPPSLFEQFFAGEMAMLVGLGEVKFVVTNTSPSGMVLVTEMTDIEILPQTKEIAEKRLDYFTPRAYDFEYLTRLAKEIDRLQKEIQEHGLTSKRQRQLSDLKVYFFYLIEDARIDRELALKLTPILEKIEETSETHRKFFFRIAECVRAGEGVSAELLRDVPVKSREFEHSFKRTASELGLE